MWLDTASTGPIKPISANRGSKATAMSSANNTGTAIETTSIAMRRDAPCARGGGAIGVGPRDHGHANGRRCRRWRLARMLRDGGAVDEQLGGGLVGVDSAPVDGGGSERQSQRGDHRANGRMGEVVDRHENRTVGGGRGS